MYEIKKNPEKYKFDIFRHIHIIILCKTLKRNINHPLPTTSMNCEMKISVQE